MRVLFAIAPEDPETDRLRGIAQGLAHRGHLAAVVEHPVFASRGAAAWSDSLVASLVLAEHDVELVVASERSSILLERAARLTPGTWAGGLDARDTLAAERELETRRARARRYGRAVFLDRDGTLMPEIGALGRPEAVRLMPGAAQALRVLAAARYELVVISNQSAIGRGAVTEEQVIEVHAALRRLLRAEGVELSGIFYCPHRPEDGCECRKPQPGLLLEAASGLSLDLDASWMIGDSTRDTGAARAAGVQAILLSMGWGGADPAAPGGAGDGVVALPDILQAARHIARG